MAINLNPIVLHSLLESMERQVEKELHMINIVIPCPHNEHGLISEDTDFGVTSDLEPQHALEILERCVAFLRKELAPDPTQEDTLKEWRNTDKGLN